MRNFQIPPFQCMFPFSPFPQIHLFIIFPHDFLFSSAMYYLSSFFFLQLYQFFSSHFCPVSASPLPNN